MKKLFISCPINGRTEENIRKSMEAMHKIAEAMFGEPLEVILSYIEKMPPEGVNVPVWYLGESIKMMAEADYFIGVDGLYGGKTDWHGCFIEAYTAGEYDIPAAFVRIADAAFFKDCVEIMENNRRVAMYQDATKVVPL